MTASKSDTRVMLDSIRQIVQLLNTLSRTVEKQAGISMAQLFVLQRLTDHEGLTINELAERSYTHQSSVSGVVQKLRKNGLVRSVAKAADRRQTAIFLTPKGKAILKKAPEGAQERFIRAFEGMSLRKQQTFRKLLEEFVAGVGTDRKRPAMFFEENK